MNKQTPWQPFIYALLIALGLLLGIWLKPASGPASGLFHPASKLEELLHMVNEAYVDSVNIGGIEESAITEVLAQLDPHSVYIPAEDVQRANEQLEGEFEGIGIEFSILNDTILVVAPIQGGPSIELGIRPGDRIVSVNGEPMTGIGITNEMVFKKLRGPKGSTVRVGINRPGSTKITEYTITRNTIPIVSVEASFMLDQQTGYIKVSRFAADTYREFRDALQKLTVQNAQQLVIDLRGNPGGYLNAVTDMADELLDDQKMMVYTVGRTQPRKEYRAKKTGLFEKGKIAILIDEGSASASEILAGAIQDNDRGLVIGRRSFGKGLVQEGFELSDGSALRLTVARYYTPSGRCIQKPYNDATHYDEEVADRYRNGELNDPGQFKQNDTLAYKTSKGRAVFGGGGIMPDLFVSLDTAFHTDFLAQAFSANMLNMFVTAWYDQNRNSMTPYQNAGRFYSNFTTDLSGYFRTYCATHEITTTDREFEISRNYIRRYLKALLARQIFRDEGYYTVLTKDDAHIRTTLESFKHYDSILRP